MARWGLLLSVLVGLSYWAYAAALLFALGREAEQFGLDYLGRLSGGDVPAAFRLTVPPDQRPTEGPGLHDLLERASTASRAGSRGAP